jgi:predicted nucleic acid-binding protein
MRIALDTNILAYAEGVNGALMRDKALKLIQRLPPEAIVLPAQALGELFNVLVRKAKRRPGRAREAVQEGFTWRGVTVANPFAPALNPILAALLAEPEV